MARDPMIEAGDLPPKPRGPMIEAGDLPEVGTNV